jgi:hypothetical protein
MIRQAQLQLPIDLRPLRNALIVLAVALSAFAGTSSHIASGHDTVCKCAHCPGGALCCCHPHLP